MIDRLPIEIWDHILNLIPHSQLQSTIINLKKVFEPSSTSSPLLDHHQFKHIIISDDHQLKSLLHRTSSSSQQQPPPQEEHRFIIPQSFSLRSWRLIDNNILINLINSFYLNLNFIDLHIGPLFAPDQLEELFLTPKPKLQVLSLRFNQNVSRRSYEPFLKGAYFDHCLDLLAKWPQSNRFHSISFVQDLPPRPSLGSSTHPHQPHGIAQPIILFRFWSITHLACSPFGRTVRNLRLRIPNRNLVIPLTHQSTYFESIPIGTHTPRRNFQLPIQPFPNLTFLDLSTSSLPSVTNDLAIILRRFPTLQHLIIDRTHLIHPSRFHTDDERVRETLRSIGSTAATTGISRAIEISKLWRELHRMIESELKDETSRSDSIETITPALSTTSSTTTTRPTPPEPKERRRGRSSYASAPRIKNSSTTLKSSFTPTPSTCTTWSYDPLPLSEQTIPSKLIIIPSPLNLTSLCCGTDLGSKDSLEVQDRIRQEWADDFEIGWQLGLQKFKSVVVEKLAVFDRSMEIWKKSLIDFEHHSNPSLQHPTRRLSHSSHDDRWKSKSDERALEHQRLIRSKPMMMILDSNPPKSQTDDPKKLSDDDGGRSNSILKIFMDRLRLREIQVEEVEERILKGSWRLEREDGRMRGDRPQFCSLNDCDSVGRVVWSDPNRTKIGLLELRPRARTIDGEIDVETCQELELSRSIDRVLRLDPPSQDDLCPPHPCLPCSTPDDPLGPLDPQVPCGHLIARQLWDVDSW